MKNKIRQQIFIAFICSAFFNACNKEFNELPQNQITEETLYKSEEGFKAATNGLYATLQNANYYGGSFITYAELYSPYSVAGGYDDATLTNLKEAAQSDAKLEATNPRIRNVWVSIYNTIRATNVFLNKGLTTKPASISADSVWNNLKAQALGIRALAHFDLLRLYGQHWDTTSIYGIPIMTKVPIVEDKPARNTVAETYAAILKDLDAAEKILSIEANQINPIEAKGSGKNYINLWVIKAIKARAFLYKGNNIKAIELADDVINNSGINLTPDISKYYTNRNGNDESIFELSFSNQNPSNLNLTTYKSSSAFINDLVCGVSLDAINAYFKITGDIDAAGENIKARAMLFEGDRSLKYSSLPALKNNPAYIFRLSEMYLIKAEANNFTLSDIAILRTLRGITSITSTNDNAGIFAEIIAELNFEAAHTMCARARLNIDDYKTNGKGIFPIPQAELLANSNMKQNPNY